jgi:hypothetical protein
MPVVNKRSGEPYDVYVGRPSEWGNPYSHIPGKGEFQVATRGDAIREYRSWLKRRINSDEGGVFIRKLAKLHGKTLACWCAPLPCHAEVLERAAAWADQKIRRGQR